MKFKQIVAVEIHSRRTMRNPQDFFARLMLHHEMLSDMRPTKWGWWEPAKHVWDVSELRRFIPNDRGGNADSVVWTRGQKPKAEGNFCIAIKPADPNALRNHASEWIHCELSQFSQEPMIDYIQQSTLQLDGDIAFIHYIAEEEKPIRYLETQWEGCYINITSLSFVTATLRHWLPNLPWAIVFGSAYVRLFGLECLLSAPAYQVKKLSDDAVYIQLSPKITDLIDDYAAVNQVREAVKNHLGRDAFFDVAKAYPLRGPIGEHTAAEALAFKPPSPIGTVFRVPDFQLIEDE